MKKFLGIGESNFSHLMENDFYYVDKTLTIKEIFNSEGIAVLITRPRRFGKTLTMSTLEAFLQIDLKNPGSTIKNEQLFKNLAITKEREFCQKNMGAWPVIFISFKSIEAENYVGAIEQLKPLLSLQADRFSHLLNSDKLTYRQKKNLKDLIDLGDKQGPSVDRLLINGLCMLEEIIYTEYGKRTVVLIDEYDVPLQKARVAGYYPEMLRLVRSIFNVTIKDSKWLHKAFLTGCLRLAKESVFTGTNNFRSFGISQVFLSEAIGFTHEEVKKILKDFDLLHRLEEVSNYYDGYRFGATSRMYCPWDVLNFCADAQLEIGDPGSYWEQTSSNDLIAEFVDYADQKHLNLLKNLIDGKVVTADIDDKMSFNELNQEHSPAQMLSLMYATGYITCVGYTEQGQMQLKIPNKEILGCVKRRITSYFSTENPGYRRVSDQFFKALVEGKGGEAEVILKEFLMRQLSLRDAAENLYHGLLLGMLADLQGPYAPKDIRSNVEAGDGYGDILCVSHDVSIGIILELKKAKSAEASDLIKSAQKALNQIKDRGYKAYFRTDTTKCIYSYGIAFYGKHCAILSAPKIIID